MSDFDKLPESTKRQVTSLLNREKSTLDLNASGSLTSVDSKVYAIGECLSGFKTFSDLPNEIKENILLNAALRLSEKEDFEKVLDIAHNDVREKFFEWYGKTH